LGDSGADAGDRGSLSGGDVLFLDYHFFAVVGVRVRVVMVLGTVDGVCDTAGSAMETVTEGVVVTVFVVVSHITLVRLVGIDGCSSSLYSNFLGLRSGGWVARVNEVDVALTVARLGVLSSLGRVTILDELGGLTVTGARRDVCVTTDDGTSALAVLAFSYVDLGRGVIGSRAVDSVEFSVVGTVLDVELCSDVAFVGLLVSIARLLAGELDLGALLLGIAARLLTGELDLGALLLGIAALLLVGVDFLLVFLLFGLADAVFFVDAELLVILTVCWDGTREGFDASFVTFPSRSLR